MDPNWTKLLETTPCLLRLPLQPHWNRVIVLLVHFLLRMEEYDAAVARAYSGKLCGVWCNHRGRSVLH